MKKTILAVALLLPLSAMAAKEQYLFDFASNKDTGKAYSALIKKENLPSWTKTGGTSTPGYEITVKGQKFTAFAGCKPHNCPAQNIAILYSPVNGEIHGLFSEYDEKTNQQKLKWMGVKPLEQNEIRGALFNVINGTE